MDVHLSILCTVCLMIINTASTASTNYNVDISCDSQWLKADNSCYFWTTADQATWSEARLQCQSRGADLMVINSPDEQSWVNIQTQEYPTDGWWIGISYVVDDDRWEWLDWTADITTVQWNLEPDNYENEDCCAVNEFGKYSDDACHSHYAYMCKVQRTQNESCPTPADNSRWLFLDYACYYISDPADKKDRHTWQDARAKCQSLKPPSVAAAMDLISITSADESRFIHETLPSMFNANMAVKWWTGLNDQAQESFYKWSDGSTWNVSYTPWDQAPSTDHSEDQNCGLMYTAGVIDDEKCSVRAGYVCEKSAVRKTLKLGCPDQWIRGGQSCYKLSNTRQTWSAARGVCQQTSGGDLLKVDNVDEEYWFEHQNLPGGRGYWTGLNDQQKEGAFVWADGSTADDSLVKWDSQPDNLPHEDCAMMFRDGSFSDFNCASRGGLICQYTKDPGAQCATGWLTYKNEGCYYIGSGNRNQSVLWQEVKQRCLDLAHSYDSELQAFYLYIYNSDQLAWLTTQLMNQPDQGTQWWTGLNDIKVEGVWKWVTDFANPVNLALIPWNTEPNNRGGNENCAMILPGGRYNDMPCSVKTFFICEISGIQTTPSQGTAAPPQITTSAAGLPFLTIGTMTLTLVNVVITV